MTAAAVEHRYRYHGTDDSCDTCSCCGRSNLKRVAWLSLADGGEPLPYGTTCAALMMLGRRVPAGEAKALIETAERDEVRAIAQRWRETPCPIVEEIRPNKHGVNCFVIGGVELPIMVGPPIEALQHARRVYKARMATTEARAALRGWQGCIESGWFIGDET